MGRDNEPGGLVILLILSCATAPEGLRRTYATEGPAVLIDWDAEPLPEIPFPNDLATRPDPSSPTGLRLNVPTGADLEAETEARQKLNEMSGWGVYAPITVAFEEPLDLDIIWDRHGGDERVGLERLDDDAVYIIDVTAGSPTYGEAVELDLGEGRFPYDACDAYRYFPNDARAGEPSVVFETFDEDLDGDGELDWGEDTDNDGVLDAPNVYPEGGDAREDLLTWYERQSNTLILRPIVPLREETTYAVVLTRRLVGEDHNPVRSPWPYINHTSQTQALMPLHEVMPEGLDVGDVNFAWTFTTGRITGDLVDLAEAVEGRGPYDWLATEVPPEIHRATPMWDDSSDPYNLPVSVVMDALGDLGLIDPEEAAPIFDSYEAFASVMVGGTFTTPYLLVDRDGDDDSDEWWQLDPSTGSIVMGTQEVTFTCILPKEGEQPYPIALYGHGYGSNRLEFLGFGHAVTRLGYAACSMDWPGHGIGLGEEEEILVEGVLRSKGMEALWFHLNEHRARDLDNDGVPDSGGDQWSADAFHTRDMVRQAILDWIWLGQALEDCGSGTMTTDDGDLISCDWDDDGTPDISADSGLSVFGGSLGGINTGVAAGVMPDVDAFAAVVPGAGLLDVGMRTEIGGAVEAMFGRLVTPMFVGYPQEDGSLQVYQLVNSVTDLDSLFVGTLPSVPAGGRIVAENLDTGVVKEGWIPADGTFRLSIGADAADGLEKTLVDEDNIGDQLVLTFYDADGDEIAVMDTWETTIEHEGHSYEAGTPLVAGNTGFGHIRGTPELRRLAMTFGAILEAGDPVAYAPYYLTGRLDDDPINVLVMPSIGDEIVPVATGIAHARVAGYIERHEIDERYGVSQDQFLIDRHVVQGLEEWGPYTNDEGSPILFDPDDLDEGTDEYDAPSEEPLRITIETSSGVSGLRLPYHRSGGTHAFGLPEPDRPFDSSTYSVFQIGTYLTSGGQDLVDDVCLQDASCDWIPQLPEEE